MLTNGLGSSFEELQTYASDNKTSVASAAVIFKSPLISKQHIWPDIIEPESLVEKDAPVLVGDRDDLLTLIAKNNSSNVQFPPSTIFLHGLGCIASALTKAFSITYDNSSIPVNLYVVTGQPPSTGKSTINKRLMMPIVNGYKKINGETDVERKSLGMEISKLEKLLSGSKDMDSMEMEEIIDRIGRKELRLAEIPEWDASLTDTTIEAAEMAAAEQQGMFNILSAEAESINVIVGAVYGDDKGGKKSNQGLVLSAWDGEYINTRRVGRKGYKGEVRATIAVLAQPDSVDTILASGASGRGLTERFLMLLEKPWLGHRDFSKAAKFDASLYRRYESMIENMLREDDVELNFSADANDFIQNYTRITEPKMRDDGEYSNSLLTGFIGKADKQIRKLAAVLHCIEHWQDGGDKSRTIKDDYAMWAASIFDELSKTFVNAADTMGYVGKGSEVEKMITVLSTIASTGKFKTTVGAIRDKVKNSRPFKGSRNLTKKLGSEILPELESRNYCILDGSNIFINPRLK